MRIIAAGTRAWMVVMRYPALVQALWWAAVAAALLASCQPALAEAREGTGDVGAWRGGGAVGDAGATGASSAAWGNVAKIPGGGELGTRGAP